MGRLWDLRYRKSLALSGTRASLPSAEKNPPSFRRVLRQRRADFLHQNISVKRLTEIFWHSLVEGGLRQPRPPEEYSRGHVPLRCRLTQFTLALRASLTGSRFVAYRPQRRLRRLTVQGMEKYSACSQLNVGFALSCYQYIVALQLRITRVVGTTTCKTTQFVLWTSSPPARCAARRIDLGRRQY